MQGTPPKKVDSFSLPALEELHRGFCIWLDRLGYATITIYSYGRMLQYFFNWWGGKSLLCLQAVDLDSYSSYLDHCPNQTLGGGLSLPTIHSRLQVLRLFGEYLEKSYGLSLPTPRQYSSRMSHHLKTPYTVLTQQEVRLLYEASSITSDPIGCRVLLGLFYGCGLRKSEGLQLQCDDIYWPGGHLQVRHGKGGRRRTLPFSGQVYEDLYSYYVTHHQGHAPQHRSFLVGMGKSTLLNRAKQLASLAGIDKRVNIHCLRHSIATHLLAQGMGLEHIRRYLGHKSLESTQVYTQLMETLNNE